MGCVDSWMKADSPLHSSKFLEQTVDYSLEKLRSALLLILRSGREPCVLIPVRSRTYSVFYERLIGFLSLSPAHQTCGRSKRGRSRSDRAPPYYAAAAKQSILIRA